MRLAKIKVLIPDSNFNDVHTEIYVNPEKAFISSQGVIIIIGYDKCGYRLNMKIEDAVEEINSALSFDYKDNFIQKQIREAKERHRKYTEDILEKEGRP